MAANKLKKLFKGKDSYAEEVKEAKAIKSGKISPSEYAKGEEMEKKMCGGGKAKKYAAGGVTKDMPNGKKMGSLGLKKGGCTKMARGGGIEVKGKTKGKFV